MPLLLGSVDSHRFAAGLVFAPRFTRLAALVMSSTAISDFLQLAYAVLQDTAG
jgi:hypothetical protein